MKTILAALSIVLCASAAHADTVNGYFRKNGTYVEPYQRSNRNNTTLDNYSTRGNVNPYTGQRGSQSPERPRRSQSGVNYDSLLNNY